MDDNEAKQGARGIQRQVVIDTPKARFTLYTLPPGRRTSWHFHSEVADWYICQEGELTVMTHAPDNIVTLRAGGMTTVPEGTVHTTINAGKRTCRFALVQGPGAYDFNTVDVPDSSVATP